MNLPITSDPGPAPLPAEKPLLILDELISLLLPHATPRQGTRRGNDRLDLYENNELMVALVTEGNVNIYHRSDMILLATAHAPFIFGLQGSLFQYELFKLIPAKDAKISVMPREKALKIVIKHHAFPQLLAYQTFINDYQAHRNNLLINRTSLHIVCGLLEELVKIDPEERIRISVAKYVLERSNLARSGVMKIIATLREEGFIIMDNGKLIQCVKAFPESSLAKSSEKSGRKEHLTS